MSTSSSPQKAVLEEEGSALRVGGGLVVPDRDADAVGQGGDHLVRHVLLDGAGDAHDLLVVGPVDLDEDRRLVLVPDDQVDVLEAVVDLGDLAQSQHGAVASAENDDVLELLLFVALAKGADPHLRFSGIDAARGQVERTAAYRGGYVVQGEPESPKAAAAAPRSRSRSSAPPLIST